jgi:membrane protease YdiL (CAAX protease family)
MVPAASPSEVTADRHVETVDSATGGLSRAARFAWFGFAVAALVALDLLDLTVWGVAVPIVAVLLWRFVPDLRMPSRWAPCRADLLAVGALWIAVVGSFWLAFEVFTTDRVAGLFLTFAAGMLIGVVGPLAWVVWRGDEPLSALGLTTQRLGATIGFGLVLAATQFAMTLWGYDLPEPVAWVPLLVMSLVVGAFEAVFFRGFVQGRLEASFGAGPAVIGAAILYSLYHVGYGMGGEEMVFLFGLGVVYATAYRLVTNVLVLWPLLTPLGAFYNNVDAGDIDLPWASIAGFVDVAVLMALAIWLTHRRAVRSSGSSIVQ